MPAVEGRYRIDATRRVLGQSRAGYFVLWSALEMPNLFWGRVASSAATTPGRDRFVARVAAHRRDDLGVAVAIGTREPEFRQTFVQDWIRAWHSRQDAPWTVKHLAITNGTHAASIGEAYRQAMLWSFREQVSQAAKQGNPASITSDDSRGDGVDDSMARPGHGAASR